MYAYLLEDFVERELRRKLLYLQKLEEWIGNANGYYI